MAGASRRESREGIQERLYPFVALGKYKARSGLRQATVVVISARFQAARSVADALHDRSRPDDRR